MGMSLIDYDVSLMFYFDILAKRGPVAYELALTTHIIFHNVFHASLLNKYVSDNKNVIYWSLL